MTPQNSQSWTSLLPFFVLAYPVTYLLYHGGRYCEPVCFAPTLIGVVTVAGTFLGIGVIAAGVALGLRTVMEGEDWMPVRPLVAPPMRARIVLFVLFGAFVFFLTLDALPIYEAVWKPIILPVSFVLFFPVWLLYGLTFPFAVLFSIAGVDPSPIITALTRSAVIVVGFPLLAVMQTYVVVIANHGRGNDIANPVITL